MTTPMHPQRTTALSLLAGLAIGGLLVAGTQSATSDAARLAEATNAVADARSIGRVHELLASEPHVAATPGDERTIERMATEFRAMGLDVEIHRFTAYLARPIDARLEILGEPDAPAGRRGIQSLDLRERNLLEDPATAHPDLTWGWNAYSGSGDVTARVVYANYGTREDFETLRSLGVDVRGAIVLARYGGNFRGYKWKFAEEAGAAGLVIYTDPADSGFVQGPTWPEGGWANDTCIQRGSILVLPWTGDPLTPFKEATKDAERLDPAKLPLPKIPVQPIGYAAAERIMARMKGEPIAADDPKLKRWIGGMKVPYRLLGGDELRVRLKVEQERFLGETANVVAKLEGRTFPDEVVVVGCHHDAWGFGAGDPLAGTMVLLESARSFAEAAKRGERPDRTILFAAWGAEEYGIIGSTEWVESRRAMLEEDAVAYINLDMAAMGDRFWASASPSLRSAIVEASKHAISPFDGRTVHASWVGDASSPKFGDLGGGSDHVGFWCHAGVPSLALGASGARGVSYHSNYDTVAWYRSIVGGDYASGLLVARMTNAVISELAQGRVWDDDPAAVVRDVLRLLDRADERATAMGSGPWAAREIAAIRDAFKGLEARADRATKALERLRRDPASADAAAANASLRALRRVWIGELPGRPWYRNLYAAPDRSSGYAPSMLPLVAEAIEDGDERSMLAASERYRDVAAAMAPLLDRLTDLGG
jgi:N-acetylated-alpha-linked acidic dipeptidase